MQKSSTHSIAITFCFKRERDSEKYFHRILLLYLPWREESILKTSNSYENKFNQVRVTLMSNILKYEPYSDVVNEAWDNTPDLDNIHDELWDDVAPSQAELNRNEDCESDSEFAILDPNNLSDSQQNHLQQSNGSVSKGITVQDRILCDVKYYELIRSLNQEQRQLHDHIFRWCHNMHLSELFSQETPLPFYIFLSGGGGVGKSHTVNAIYQSALRQLRLQGSNPELPTVILTASTGKAAVNIGGTTLHSAFSLRIKKRQESHIYHKLSQSTLNTLRSKYLRLKIVIIDEISMVGGQTLSNLDMTLRDITEKDLPFGGLSILAVGDLLQLNPVGDRPVFQPSSSKYILEALGISSWQSLFQLYELKTIVRQQGDPYFAELLSRVRTGDHTKDDISFLKNLENNDELSGDCMCLFLTNAEVDLYNVNMLSSLKTKTFTIVARDVARDNNIGLSTITINSTNPHETGGLRTVLNFAVGARYMHTKNTDIEDNLVNGALGTIKHIHLDTNNPLSGTIFVLFGSPNIGKKSKLKSTYSDCVPIHAISETFRMP